MPKAAQTLDIAPAAPTKAADRRGKVQSATNAVEVLKALADIGGAAPLTVLAARLKENPAKVHRYLASLCATGFVVQEAVTARYVLGPEAMAVGLAAMRQSEVLELAGAELVGIAHTHELSCFVSVLGSHGPTVVRWVEPLQSVTVNVKTGSVMSVLWSATGRAFGAFSRARLLDSLVHDELAAASPAQRKLLPNPRAVEALFDEVRALGCAPVTDTLMVGISAVAYPIFNAYAEVVAVITALGPSGTFDPTPGRANATVVQEAATRIGRRLGFKG